jgi:putative membrane protein
MEGQHRIPMSQEEKKINLNNELAKERTRIAEDRTLMAWIRTSISLIGFGFAIAQSYEYIEKGYMETSGKILDSLHRPFIFGISFMILGMLGVLGGVFQYRQNLKRIKDDGYNYAEPWPLPLILSMLLLLVALLGFILVLL